MKIVAPTTSHSTIHGNVTPKTEKGSGAKIRLTNQPVEPAKMSLTRWSRLTASCARAGSGAAMAAVSLLLSLYVPRHPRPGYETRRGWRAEVGADPVEATKEGR